MSISPPASVDTAAFESAARALAAAERVTVLTGAGISAESGVPTFRGEGGYWRNHEPTSLATPEAFRADTKTVWAWYRHRQQLVRACSPNAAHHALVALQRDLEARGGDLLLVTQNVDSLHEVAGSEGVIELHGNLFADRCTACGTLAPAWERAEAFDVDPDDPDQDPELPSCEACGGLTRPGVVWFGESLPEGAIERAAEHASRADLLLVVGTSGVVYPAAGLIAIARQAGAHVVIVNLDPMHQDDLAHDVLRGRAGEVLPALREAAEALR